MSTSIQSLVRAKSLIKHLSLLTLLTTSSYASALDVDFVDNKWDGETIPKGNSAKNLMGSIQAHPS